MRDVIDLRTEKATFYTGLKLTVDESRESRRAFAFRTADQFESTVIIMPCGERASFSAETLPTDDVPCPCGAPNHTLVHWESAAPSGA